LVTALVQTKKARSPEEAFQYLQKISEEFRVQKRHVTVTDFSGGTPKILKRLKDQLDVAENEKEKGDEALYRIHGVVGHMAIPQLIAKRQARKILRRSFEQKEIFSSGKKPGVEQIPLDFGGNSFGVPSNAGPVPKRFRINKRFVRELNACWEKAKAAVGGDKWFDRYRCLKPFQLPLQKLLIRIFGEEVIRQIVKYRGPLADYLTQLTLMSWASAVVYASGSGRRVIFREVPVLAHRYGVSGGRIDALELASIDGKPLGSSELRTLAVVVNRYEADGGRSVGQIVADLERLFHGRELEFKIWDWKFAVGDSPEVSKVVEEGDVKDKPFPKHVSQMLRYLTFASIDYHLARHGNNGAEWSRVKYFESATLVYFFPLVRPVFHKVSASPEDKEKFFVGIVQGWHRTKERANVRILSNFLVGHVISTLKGKNGGHPDNGNNHNGNSHYEIRSGQGALFDEEAILSIERMVSSYRNFADPDTKMFENVGVRESDGSTILLFHFDRLKEAVEKGRPVARGFSWEHGGKVLCPVHDDTNPSLHVYVERRFVKCFSCGVFARFSEEGLMRVLPHLIGESHRFIKPNQTLQNLKIPSRHLDVMGTAGVFMNLALPESIGERYLVKERFLDANLAYAMGVGFCDDRRFFNEMLDSGVSFEEMVYYGFIGFSEEIRMERSLAPILLRRGLALRDIKKTTPSKGGPVESLPYSVLGGRVIFPLSIDGRWVSFYGRDAKNRGKTFVHRKLIVSESNIPHGIFNEQPLFSDASEVILVEAPIDTLTMIQMGNEATSGLVGVKNFLILELVARTGKRVAVGLDNDEGGRRGTDGYIKEVPNVKGGSRGIKIIGLLEWFEKRGIQVRDFTKEFVQQNGGEGWDDWNSYYKQIKARG